MALSVEEKRARKAAYMREWKRRNHDKVIGWVRKYKAANPEKVRAWNKKSAQKSRVKDPAKHRAAANKHREAHKEERQAATLAWAHARPGQYLLYNAKYRASRLGLPFNLTMDDIVIPERCPILGIPIEATVRGRRGFHPNSPSIDRIIPELGYVKGNIAIISMRANSIKRDGTADELTRIANWLNRETARVERELAG